MKKLICCFTLLFSVSLAFSQRVYFIYLQSDAEPFFLKMNEQVYSPGSTGYVILSKLRDSSYAFAIGFPQNKWPEQQFKVDIKGRDHGYLLKNFGEKGWGLYDLQTLSVQMAATQPDRAGKNETMEVSAFTDILAKASNDPSLRERPAPVMAKQEVLPIAAKKEEVKEKETAPVQALAKTDIAVKKEEPAVIVPEKEQPVVKASIETITRPETDTIGVSKKEEKPSSGTLAKTDIPEKKEEPSAVTKAAVTQPPVAGTVTRTEVAAKKEEPPATKAEDIAAEKEEVKTVKEEPKIVAAGEYKPTVVRKRSESSTTTGFGLTFTDEYADGKRDTIRIIIPPVQYSSVVIKEKEPAKEDMKFLDISTDPKEKTKPAAAKSCASVAGESDFLKLRKKMAAESKEDGMVGEAAKQFRSKCFTVAQIKNLSALFLNDAGKYKFFDVAYTHVADTDNFISLQAELKEEYYINRFKAMLR